MTIRHIKIFAALCACGCNTTKAAESLHMTQPAVSLAIREMEQYYGTPLFDRIGRRLLLTQAGEQFLRYAHSITGLFDDMEKELRNWDSAVCCAWEPALPSERNFFRLIFRLFLPRILL